MTKDELQAVISQITYKPTFLIRMCDNMWMDGVRPEIVISMKVPHRDSGEMDYVHLTKVIEPHELEMMLPFQAVVIIHGMIRSMELHEVDEWFKVSGIRLFDPHVAPAERVLLGSRAKEAL